MEKAIEVVRQRIEFHKHTIESFYMNDSDMNDSDFVNAKHIRQLHNLIKEDEQIIKLLTEAV